MSATSLANLPLAAFERTDVMALHESLCESPAMANVVVETLTYMYKRAKGWNVVPEIVTGHRKLIQFGQEN